MGDVIFFYIFAILTLGGAVLCITRKSAVHSAIWLVVSLMGVAGLYLLQKAEFLFAVQIVLYIGGIVVLFLFVIMLVNLDEAAKKKQFNNMWPIAIACVVLVGAEVTWFLTKGYASIQLPAATQAIAQAMPRAGNVEMLADVLFTEYLLPFEVASLLLLVAVVGSVMMAKKRV